MEKRARQWMGLVTGIAAACLLLPVCAALAQTPEAKHYECHRMSGPVTIDGKLDEPAWQQLPAATGFFLVPTARYAAGRQTEFRMGWDDKAIYLGVHAVEPAAAGLAALPLEKRAGELLELFFMPERPTYFQLAPTLAGRNAYGGKFRLRMQNRLREIPADAIQMAAVLGADGWTMEVAVPFALLDATPADGATWSFNVVRVSTLGGKSGEPETTWAHLPWHNFHDYDDYATLRFVNATLPESGAQVAAQRLNEAYTTSMAHRQLAEQREAALRARLGAAASLTFTNGMRSSSDFLLKAPMDDELRGMRYYGSLPVCVTFSWPAPVTFDASRIVWYSPMRLAEDYGLEWWDGNAWRVVFHDEHNASGESIAMFEPITTEKVRLTVFKATRNYETLRVRAFDLFRLEGRAESKLGETGR